MKMFKDLLTSLLTFALVLSGAVQVNAAEYSNDPYTYTIRFYAGNQGTFTDADWINVISESEDVNVTFGAELIEVSGLDQGDKVTYTPQAGVSLEADSKYYVKGIRLSGRDNDDIDAATAFTVSEDTDYVVGYGIKGNQTSYTVNYYDENGNQLAPSDTFYGNVGDKAVVAYKYIEGFVPQNLGFAKTLSENAAENVFDFVYEEAPEPDVIIQEVPGTGTGTDDAGQGQGGAGGAGEDADDGQGGTGEDQVPGDGTESGDSGDDKDDDDIVDLDDDKVPQADIDADGNGLGLIGSIGIGVIGLIAFIIIILMMLKKRKKE